MYHIYIWICSQYYFQQGLGHVSTLPRQFSLWSRGKSLEILFNFPSKYLKKNRLLTLWIPNFCQKILFLTIQSGFLAAMMLNKPNFCYESFFLPKGEIFRGLGTKLSNILIPGMRISHNLAFSFCHHLFLILFVAPFLSLFLGPFTLATFCIACSFWLPWKVGC